MTREAELHLARTLARGRAWITGEVIRPAQEQALLLDRWYPSEAALRRHLLFEECLDLNREYGVASPDLVVAVVCDPRESWHRAHARERGFDSVAIRDFVEHQRSCQVFEEAAGRNGWLLVQTDQSPDIVAAKVYLAVTDILVARV
jgi:thymidylate kinase